MRKLFPLAGLGCAALIIFGLIGGGVFLLVEGGRPYLEKLSSRRGEPQPPAVQEQPEPPQKQPGPKPPQKVGELPGKVAPAEEKNLLAARQGHKTLHRKRLDPPKPVPTEIPAGKVIDYAINADDRLSAFVSLEPKDEEKHPAVIWVHSGVQGLTTEVWDQTEPFRKAGFFVMCPSFRGEHKNVPEQAESFYGEVNDLLLAIDNVRDRSYVDSKRIYVVGEIEGGTLALLTATTGTNKVRAFVAMVPIADMLDYYRKKKENEKLLAFDLSVPEEGRLRSAIRFTQFIKQPTFSLNPPNAPIQSEQAARMAAEAEKYGVPFHSVSIPDTKKSLPLNKLTPLLVQKFLADTGPACNLGFTDDDFKKIPD